MTDDLQQAGQGLRVQLKVIEDIGIAVEQQQQQKPISDMHADLIYSYSRTALIIENTIMSA